MYFYVRWLRPGPVLLCARRDTICAICVVVGEGVLCVGEGGRGRESGCWVWGKVVLD